MKRKAPSPAVLTGRKRRKISSNLRKTIKSVVYKTVNKNLETKRFGSNTQTNFFDGECKLTNITFPIAQGDGPSNRDGVEIILKGVTVRTECLHNLNQNITFHVAIVSLDFAVSGFMTTAGVSPSLFFANSGSHPNNWRFDKDRCTVLMSKKVKVNGSYSTNAGAERNGNIKFNWSGSKKLIYNEVSGFLKDRNYYVLYWAAVPTGGLLVGTMSSDVTVYFKA